MMTSLIQVALGGAAGAVLRYSAGIGIIRLIGHSSFPVAIIFVNVIGSFLMGVFVVAAAHRGLTFLSPLIMTGFLGGFTTFSAFSLEAVTLYERGDLWGSVLYVVVSVIFSILGLILGLWIARGVLV